MSTQPPALPRANSSAAVNSPAGQQQQQPAINSISDSARTAQAFFEAVRAFTASPSFHGTAELIDEVPRLRKVVADRDREVRSLTARVDEQKREFEARLDEREREHEKLSEGNLHVYNKEYERHRQVTKELDGQIERLTAEMKKEREEITTLHTGNEELMKQGTKVRAMLEAEKERYRKAAETVEGLRKEVEKRNEMIKKEAERRGAELAELAAKLKKAETEAQKAKSSFMTCHQENVELQRDLEDATKRLDELESFTEPLSDDQWEASISLLDELWRSAHDLISSYFRKDLPKEILANNYAWTEIRKPADFKHSIPLPQSNSHAAKSMRIAVILAILARLIDRYLFQPSYILPDDSGLREVLVRQAIESSRKEAFTRGIFLATFEDEQADIADECVTRIVKELMHHIHDLLPAAHAEGFKARLERIVQDARDIWWKTQRLRLRLEPDFQLDDYYGWEQPIQFQLDYGGALPTTTTTKPDNNAPPPQQQISPKTTGPITPALPAPTNGHHAPPVLPPSSTSSLPLLLIFPRIYIVEDDDPEPVTPGTVLLASQAADADRELQALIHAAAANGLGGVGVGGVGARTALYRGGGGGSLGGALGSPGVGVMRVGGPRPRRLSVPLMEEIPEVETPGEGSGSGSAGEKGKGDFLEGAVGKGVGGGG